MTSNNQEIAIDNEYTTEELFDLDIIAMSNNYEKEFEKLKRLNNEGKYATPACITFTLVMLIATIISLYLKF
jgi:serine/threonine-protein kinase RIO1